MVVKTVAACLPPDLHKRAVLNDISWSKALQLGVEIMLGNNNSEEKLTEDINRINGELCYKQKALMELRHRNEEERLRKEREQYIHENDCFVCKEPINGRKFTVENQKLCRKCFLALTPDPKKRIAHEIK